MVRGGVSQFKDPQPATPVLTASLMAEAVVRAAMATGELTLLAYRDEQALKGHCAFKARWVAFAALSGMRPDVPASVIARPLGCGRIPFPGLAGARRQAWWDEAMVDRLLLDLEGAPDRRDLQPCAGLHKTVAGILGDLIAKAETAKSGQIPGGKRK